MEIWIASLCFFLVMLRVSPAEKPKKNLTGIVGGSIILPDPLPESGSLLYGTGTIAYVIGGSLQIRIETYKNKLQWNKNSGLFTLTDLQKNDSGDYRIEFMNEQTTFSYSLKVYDPVPSPTVENQTVRSDSCWLICSVDKQATLLWIRDQEILIQQSSALSLNITVHKEDRKSSYRCVAANPAENKTFHVNLTSSCGFNETETPNDFDHRTYWIPVIVCIAFFTCVILGAWIIKQKYLGKKESSRQTQGSMREEEVQYTPIHFRAERSNQTENIPDSTRNSESNNLSTVYAKLEHPNTDRPSLLTANG